MLKIKTARQPSLHHIDGKYHYLLHKIIVWSKTICALQTADLYGLYVRGSIPLGCPIKDSDLDIVILVSECSLDDVLHIKATVRTLLSLYRWCRLTDIKVFNVKNAYAEPPTELPEDLYEKALKYINFDLSANGINYYGKNLNDALSIYQSDLEFREVNQMMWGAKIEEMIKDMNNFPSYEYPYYYPLIKRCIRLAAYVKFTTDSLYYGTTEACFEFAIKNNTHIERELNIIYHYYIERNIQWKTEDITKLISAIKAVSDYILNEENIKL